jgi:spore coat protein CotH
MKKLFTLFFCSTLACSVAQNNDGDSLFNAPVVHDVYITFSQAGYWDSLVANYTADVYMKCDIILDGRSMPQCGIKFKGNSSYNNPSMKKSFKLDFNEYVSGQDYNDLKKLNLNNGFKDPTLMREKIALDYLTQLGIPAPRCAFSRVYINNVYWGLYTLVEEVDKTFLDDRFYDKKGNLFKGDPTGDLKWYGSAASSYYTKYELKTNETLNDWSDLVRLIDKINNSTTTQFHDSLEKYMNTTSWIRSWAAMNIFVNLDSYLGSGHNYYIYDDSITWKFNFINWDVNEAFGNFNMGMTLTQIKNLSMYYVSSTTSRPLCTKMLANTAYKAALTQEFCEQIQNSFSNTLLDPKIDSLANAIRADVYADTLKSYSNQNFEDNIVMDINLPGGPGVGGNFAGLKPFITARKQAITTELASNGCYVSVNEHELPLQIEVFPNPANSILSFSSPVEIKTVRVFSVDGKLVYSSAKSNKNSLDVSALAPGIYFVQMTATDNRSAVKKFSKD